MNSELTTIVQAAYTHFKKYKAPSELDVCTDCCVTQEEVDGLTSMAVQHLPFKLLYTYNTAAKTPKPGLDEFRHFLPRILELTADYQFISHSAALTLSRCAYYSEEEWEQNELELIRQFGLSFFEQCMRQYPLPELEHIDSIIIMLHKAYVPIDELLQIWFLSTPQRSGSAFQRLADVWI